MYKQGEKKSEVYNSYFGEYRNEENTQEKWRPITISAVQKQVQIFRVLLLPGTAIWNRRTSIITSTSQSRPHASNVLFYILLCRVLSVFSFSQFERSEVCLHGSSDQ
jgi:hypothetical protein